MIEKVTNALLMHEMVVNLIKHMLTAPKHLSKWFIGAVKRPNNEFLVFFFAKKVLFGSKFFDDFLNLNERQPNDIPKFRRNRRALIFLPIFHDTP